MKSAPTVKVPPNLIFTAVLSGGLIIILSAVYTILTILALAFRFQCDLPIDTWPASNFFIINIFVAYIQDANCHDYPRLDLTHPDTVLILVILALIVSVCAVIAASFLIAVVREEKNSNYIVLASYIYIGVCVAMIAVDLTSAIFFGTDYSALTSEMDEDGNFPGFDRYYRHDIARLGAIFLVALSLKGFVAHAINIVLLIMLIVYVVDYQKQLKTQEHSIHKLGALNAYDQQRRQDDPWRPQSEIYQPSPGSRNRDHVNHTYMNDDDLSPLPPQTRSPMRDMRENTMSDYSNNRFYDRSESWQHRSASGSRPFSYLEEAKRPAPMRPPPVPAPDYSPPARRLKSVLKPGYM